MNRNDFIKKISYKVELYKDDILRYSKRPLMFKKFYKYIGVTYQDNYYGFRIDRHIESREINNEYVSVSILSISLWINDYNGYELLSYIEIELDLDVFINKLDSVLNLLFNGYIKRLEEKIDYETRKFKRKIHEKKQLILDLEA